MYNFFKLARKHNFTVTSHSTYDNVNTVLTCPARLGFGFEKYHSGSTILIGVIIVST
jgi:hypothetical protein